MPHSALRVLIAEDNEINLEVCRHFLSQAGIDDTVAAGTGMEVLRLLEPDPLAFDLILMDVRMPEMDGIQATREILARWPDPASRPRIVALTAHAFVEETRRCLDAGMDGCLSKPLRRQDLESTLGRVFGQAVLSANLSDTQPIGGLGRRPLIDWRQFDMIVDAPDSPCVEIFHRFLETVPDLLTGISEAAGQSDATRCADLCHQLKGTSSSFGFAAFADAMKNAEYAARSGGNLTPAINGHWLARCLVLLSASREEIRAQRGV